MYQKLKEIVDAILKLESTDLTLATPVLLMQQSNFMNIEKYKLSNSLRPVYQKLKDLYNIFQTSQDLAIAVQNQQQDQDKLKALIQAEKECRRELQILQKSSDEFYDSMIEAYNQFISSRDASAAIYTPQVIKQKIGVLKEFRMALKPVIRALLQQQIAWLDFENLNSEKSLQDEIDNCATHFSCFQAFKLQGEGSSLALKKLIDTMLEGFAGHQLAIQTIKEKLEMIQHSDITATGLLDAAESSAALELLSKFNPGYNESNPNILLMDIADQGRLVTHQQETILQLGMHLAEYIKQREIARDLRTKYKMMNGLYQAANNADIPVQDNNPEKRQAELQRLQKLLIDCKTCIKKLENVQLKENELKKLEEDLSKRKKQMRPLRKAFKTSIPMSQQLSEKLAETIVQLAQLNQITDWQSKQEPIQITSGAEDIEELLIPENAQSEEAPIEIYQHNPDVLNGMHEKIVALFRQIKDYDTSSSSEEEPGCNPFCAREEPEVLIQLTELNVEKTSKLESWYERLFEVLPWGTRQTENAQVSQLLRDIHFELSKPDPERKLAVLEAYRDICPNPDENNCFQLLKYKPTMMVEADIIIDLNQGHYGFDDSIKPVLLALRAQIQSLRQARPREAELLNQLTNNLEKIALQIKEPHLNKAALPFEEDKPAGLRNRSRVSSLENRNKLTYENKSLLLAGMGDFLEDPRYQPLHQHRGFHMVTEWFAKLAVDLQAWFNKAPKADYRSVSFFKPTYSVHLIQTLSQEIEKGFSSQI